MGILKRVAIVVAVIVVVAAIGYALTDDTTAAALRQWFVWIWRGISEAVGLGVLP